MVRGFLQPSEKEGGVVGARGGGEAASLRLESPASNIFTAAVTSGIRESREVITRSVVESSVEAALFCLPQNGDVVTGRELRGPRCRARCRVARCARGWRGCSVYRLRRRRRFESHGRDR